MICLPCWQSDDDNNNNSNGNHSKVEFGFCSVSFFFLIYSVLLFALPLAHSVHDCKLVFLFDYLSHALYTRTTFSFSAPPTPAPAPPTHRLQNCRTSCPTPCAANAKPWEPNMSFYMCVELHYSIIYHICIELALGQLWFSWCLH